MLLIVMAIAGADPTASILDSEVRADGFIWTEQSVTWTEIPDPDPEGILPPIKGLHVVKTELGNQPKGSRPFARSAPETERRVNEALRRAEEAVAKAQATVVEAGAE